MNALDTMSNNTVHVNVRTVHRNGSRVQKKKVAALSHTLSGPIAEKNASKATDMWLQR